jgi:hypothetical protein
MTKVKFVTPAEVGVQRIGDHLQFLDSSFRRNDPYPDQRLLILLARYTTPTIAASSNTDVISNGRM